MKNYSTYFIVLILSSILLITGCSKKETNQFSQPEKGERVAEIVIKNHGSIFVKFFEKEAPKAVENFITHGKNGYYDGVNFHRIIEDFMIQGGDPEGTGTGGESIWNKDFEDEFDSNLHPYRGALCMANRGANTNGSQFFIVQSKDTYTEEDLKMISLSDRTKKIGFNEDSIKNYGEIGGTPWLFESHTVFGQVYEGLDVLDEIVQVEMSDPEKGIPLEEIVIETVKVFTYES